MKTFKEMKKILTESENIRRKALEEIDNCSLDLEVRNKWARLLLDLYWPSNPELNACLVYCSYGNEALRRFLHLDGASGREIPTWYFNGIFRHYEDYDIDLLKKAIRIYLEPKCKPDQEDRALLRKVKKYIKQKEAEKIK